MATPNLNICNYKCVKICDEFGVNARFSLLFQEVCALKSATGLNGYNIGLQSAYTAVADGETELTLRSFEGVLLPAGAILTWVVKGVSPISPLNYIFVSPTITLLNGISMGADEVLSFQYVVPI